MTKNTVVVVEVRIVTQSMTAWWRMATVGLGVVMYVVVAETDRQEQAEDTRSGRFPAMHL